METINAVEGCKKWHGRYVHGMRIVSAMTHTCREANLLAARFQRDLRRGRTELFSAASDRDEEGGATSGEDGVENAYFQPDGRSNTGSSPASRDLMVERTRASSSWRFVWVMSSFLSSR